MHTCTRNRAPARQPRRAQQNHAALANARQTRAQPAHQSSGGRTPLHLSAQNDFSGEFTEALIGAGAAVDAVGSSGMTPLMRAASYGKEGSVRVLLAHGANRELRDKNGYGKTALQKAQSSGTPHTHPSHGPNGKERNKPGCVALLQAAPGPAPAPAPVGVFGSAPSAGASLPAAGGMFGASPPSPAPASPASGLFGSAAPSAGGIFGAAKPAAAAPAGAGLFGNHRPAAAPAFGKSPAAAPAPAPAPAPAAAAPAPAPAPATMLAPGLVSSGPFRGHTRPAALVQLNKAFRRDVARFVEEAAATDSVDLSSCMREYLGLAAEIKGV